MLIDVFTCYVRKSIFRGRLNFVRTRVLRNSATMISSWAFTWSDDQSVPLLERVFLNWENYENLVYRDYLNRALSKVIQLSLVSPPLLADSYWQFVLNLHCMALRIEVIEFSMYLMHRNVEGEFIKELQVLIELLINGSQSEPYLAHLVQALEAVESAVSQPSLHLTFPNMKY